ncbi:DUF6261 family protein [Flavobacterium sp. UBA6031]|uniref:DUF6261 family protein n=1 Tax=Flavobacterium sp. UBA6031 TaxID=1946551 RepID=UPI0025C412D5|nr:DUF6261 family protein [Flavobacterium sp. UBA6031]
MEKKELSDLNVARVGNDDAASLFKMSYEIAIPVRTEIGDLANAALTRLQTTTDPFVEQVDKLRKSELTDDVEVDRKVCSNLLAEIKRTVVYELKSRDLTKKTSAEKLNFFISPYWDLSKKAIAAQFELTTEMLNKYQADPAMVSAAQTVGVSTIMTELETDNNTLGTTYKARNKEIGERKASATKLRPPASESYIQFCTAIEQAVNLMPNEALLSLFNSMDALRKKTHALIGKTPPPAAPVAE